MEQMDLDRFRGCLIGGAAGDALGYAVEFMNNEEVRTAYGDQGITAYTLVEGKALISDDTQMTLFSANGLLNGATEECVRGSRRPMERYLHNAYMDWYRTQRLLSSAQGKSCCWLVNVNALHSVRAPGGTCLRSLSSGVMGTMEHPINTSKGCGGLMRVSPIGLLFDPAVYPPDEIDLLGAKSAALTHGHPLGFITAALLVHIINCIVYGSFTGPNALHDIVCDAENAIRTQFARYEKVNDLCMLIDKAVSLSAETLPNARAIATIGEGWVAEEALAIAIYCALKYSDNFEKAIVASVNHSGDSDSTGSITGGMLGAYLGLSAIPTQYRQKLELYNVIDEIAQDLYAGRSLKASDDCRSSKWAAKYITHDYRM